MTFYQTSFPPQNKGFKIGVCGHLATLINDLHWLVWVLLLSFPADKLFDVWGPHGQHRALKTTLGAINVCPRFWWRFLTLSSQANCGQRTVTSHCDVVLSACFGEKTGSSQADGSWAPPRVSVTPRTHVLKGTQTNHGPWAPELDEESVSKFMTMLLNKTGKKGWKQGWALYILSWDFWKGCMGEGQEKKKSGLMIHRNFLSLVCGTDTSQV